MQRKKHVLLMMLLLMVASACSAQPTQTAAPAAADLPLTETEVPRVSLEETKAALENGEAIIVDVRSAAAYETSHVAGAINIPLGEIETNPNALDLDKEQWIITYCT